jgi:probable HAF family extracellular repeat protein
MQLGRNNGQRPPCFAQPPHRAIHIADNTLSSRRALRYSPDSGVQTLSNLPSDAFSINSVGDVVGEYWPGAVSYGKNHAFLYTDEGGFKDLGTLGGASSGAIGVTARLSYGNVTGPYIVGTSTASTKSGSPNLPFVYHAGFGMVELAKLIQATSGTVFTPYFINDDLMMFGSANNGYGFCYLDPV